MIDSHKLITSKLKITMRTSLLMRLNGIKRGVGVDDTTGSWSPVPFDLNMGGIINEGTFPELDVFLVLDDFFSSSLASSSLSSSLNR